MKIEFNKEKVAKVLQEHPEIAELMKNGIQKDDATGLEYFTGYEYKTLYDWDQYFEALVQVLVGWDSKYIRNGVIIFLENIREDGFIPRHIPVHEVIKNEHVKPFLSQIAKIVVDYYGEKEWILHDKYFYRLQKYLDYWLFTMDKSKSGLSVWASAPHTGMDNQHERAGYWNDDFCEGVDLNSYLVNECRAFAFLCELKGESSLAKMYLQYADERAEKINTLMWDGEDGFYYDRNAKFGQGNASQYSAFGSRLNELFRGKKIACKTVAGFMPLFAGIASEEQAARLVSEHLLNADEFWTSYPVATMARNNPFYFACPLPTDTGCNWRATTWIPTNFMVFMGLKNYGFDVVAKALSAKTKNMLRKSGNREWYLSETGDGQGLNPFWGWSLLAHFFDCIE